MSAKPEKAITLADEAREFLRLSEPHLGGNRTELRAWVEQLRAGIYAKIGKPDLELESYMNSFAVRHVGIPTHYFIS